MIFSNFSAQGKRSVIRENPVLFEVKVPSPKKSEMGTNTLNPAPLSPQNSQSMTSLIDSGRTSQRN